MQYVTLDMTLGDFGVGNIFGHYQKKIYPQIAQISADKKDWPLICGLIFFRFFLLHLLMAKVRTKSGIFNQLKGRFKLKSILF